MVKFLLSMAVLVWANPGFAQDWNLSDADIPLDHFSASALTAGSTITFPDNGQSRFSVGGSYSYTYANDAGIDFGLFQVRPDGRVCIDIRDGKKHCNLFVRSGGLLVMLSEKGERFPVRVHFSLKP